MHVRGERKTTSMVGRDDSFSFTVRRRLGIIARINIVGNGKQRVASIISLDLKNVTLIYNWGIEN